MDFRKMISFKSFLSKAPRGRGVALIVVALLVAGCKQEETASVQAQAAAAAPSTTSTANTPWSNPLASMASSGTYDPSGGKAQPKLPTLKLWVGTNEVTGEIAQTPRQIQTGMMWRTNMAEMEGMLFVFPQPHQVAFYMRNTLVPLSCAYIDAEGTILEIYDMKPRDETPIPSKSDQVQYVLEMRQGWFERHGVKAGVAISTERGTLPQTFRRR
jgi:uncharacterized protein